MTEEKQLSLAQAGLFHWPRTCQFCYNMPMAKQDEEKSLSTESYKGVRDFYPEDQFVQNYIFGVMGKVAKQFGYQEYGASVLEPAELYRAKSGEEIVNEQTYTFADRGDREVTLRPEMTPTVARMVAAKRRELSFPIRWYSIPNLFRYEKPQRGRLREHWQLNVDIFGVESIQAEVEIISLASEIMRAFGVTDNQFEIRVNNRKVVNYILKTLMGLTTETAGKVAKAIDRKEKVSHEVFGKMITDIVGEKDNFLLTLLSSKNFEEFVERLPEDAKLHDGIKEIKTLIQALEKLGITNVVFDQTLMRGFDYYTGIVFEVFDLNPANRRALFGGGRYDDLLEIFEQEKVPTVGFGMGDVTMRDVLETYNLLPAFKTSTKLVICTVGAEHVDYAQELAQKLRAKNISVVVDYSGKKVGDQIKRADKQGVPFVICVGEEEVESGKLKIKNLKTAEEKVLAEDEVAKFILTV
ncbi:MAG: Histidine-tRNA ligase [Parcubacteria group bacterium GW2011_GWA2_47_16]|nr:MAG: Histidine-tRNA ligase [Parcubacteria group bacterium GW2011_GWA2_47_16]